ncbi:DUF6270 domain-containing protein [Arthrobacter rhombi]|uniref:DUF6270 domain-containing protein n=1 Tax=Arthrobacter rhombi TaxID=71253 RepID=UPI003FD67D59
MKGLFAYGGCVTRDSFELLKSDYSLVSYVARQSLASSGHAPIVVPKKQLHLGSPFQQRQLVGDVESNFFPALRRYACTSDAIILDLVVERLGIRQYQKGFLTQSNELSKSPLGKSLTTAHPSIRFATNRHFKLWSYGARQLARVLRQESALGRTIVFDTPWASQTSTGTELPGFRSQSSAKMNELYKPYYAYLRELGFRVLRLPDETVLSDANHQWGPAPYHYISEAYAWMAQQVRVLPPRQLDDSSSAESGRYT